MHHGNSLGRDRLHRIHIIVIIIQTLLMCKLILTCDTIVERSSMQIMKNKGDKIPPCVRCYILFKEKQVSLPIPCSVNAQYNRTLTHVLLLLRFIA